MKKIISLAVILVLFSSSLFASSVGQKKPFPYGQGVSLSKNVLYLNARELSAGAGLGTLWSDTFKDNTQINSGSSTSYTYRGASDYDVIVDTSTPAAHAAMTSNSAPVPLVASSDSATGGQLAYMIFDYNSAASYWQASGAYPHWAKIDLGSAKTVTTYKYTSYDGVNYPTAWTLEGSNDDSAWTVLDTVSAGTSGTDVLETVASPGSYRYYKFNFTGGTNQEVLWHAAKLYTAASSQAVVRSVTTTLGASISEAMVFVDMTLNTGTLDLVRVSADAGTTWKTVTNNLEQIVSLGHSGASLIVEVTFSGDAELEFWGVAA